MVTFRGIYWIYEIKLFLAFFSVETKPSIEEKKPLVTSQGSTHEKTASEARAQFDECVTKLEKIVKQVSFLFQNTSIFIR